MCRSTRRGGSNLIAHALFRSPVFAPPPLDVGEQQEVAVFVWPLAEGGVEAANWMFQAATKDEDFQLLLCANEKDLAVQNLPPSHPAHGYRGV